MMEKRCSACGQVKPVEQFYWNVDRERKGGGRWRPRCKACEIAAVQAYQRAHPRPPTPPKPLQTEKQCNRCHIVKPAADFQTVPHYTRLWPYCRACVHLIRAENYRKKPAANVAKTMRWRRENQHRASELSAAHRARKRNAPVIERINRAAIIARDNGTCYLCGCKPIGRKLTLDHVIPLSRGGNHTADNLRVCCASCNSRKWRHLDYKPVIFDMVVT